MQGILFNTNISNLQIRILGELYLWAGYSHNKYGKYKSKAAHLSKCPIILSNNLPHLPLTEQNVIKSKPRILQ